MRKLVQKNTYSDAVKKRVFALRTKGLSYGDISLRLDIPAVTVGYWIRKAIEAHPRKYKRLIPTRKEKKQDFNPFNAW